MNQWKPYIIALAIGFLVGAERENSKQDRKALGVRTFILLGLLGALAGGMQNAGIATAITFFSLGLILVSYGIQVFSKTEVLHLGLTTEFAAGIVFIACYLAHDFPALAALAGPLVALVLFSKTTLHRFTQAIKPLELRAAITILLIAAVVIDLIPDVAVDPWQVFNPRKFGFLILTLATLEFLSYLLLKIMGEKKGSLIIGFLGGLVSSTAIVISSARHSKQTPDSWRILLDTALSAQIASLFEMQLIMFLISTKLFLPSCLH